MQVINLRSSLCSKADFICVSGTWNIDEEHVASFLEETRTFVNSDSRVVVARVVFIKWKHKLQFLLKYGDVYT